MTQWSKAGVKDSRSSASPPHDGIQSAMVVEEAINRKFTKVAVIHDSTNYGVSGRDDLLDQIKKQGNKLQVVATEKFNIGDKDMTAQLLRAKSAGAQAILIWGIGPELAAVCQRHGQDRHEGAAHRRLDPVHVQLHRQCRQERQRHPHAPDFHRGAHHPQGQGLHRRLSTRPTRSTACPPPVSAAQGYDAVLYLRRGGQAGPEHRHAQNQGGSGGPQGAREGRHRHLEPPLHQVGSRQRARPTRPSAANRWSWAWCRTAAWSSPMPPTGTA